MNAVSHALLAPSPAFSAAGTRSERGANRSLSLRRSVSAARAEPALPERARDDHDDDLALVRGLLRRDELAWRAFRRRFDPLTQRAIARVSRRGRAAADRHEVEEIHAALMCSLLEHDMRKLRSFDAARGTLSAFLHVLATHAAIAHGRSRARSRRDTPLDEAVQVLAAPEHDPSVLLDDARRRTALAGALDALSERDRTFVELLYVEEQTAEQVARKLQVTIETVYTKKVRIQQRLRKAHARSRR